MSNLRYLLAIPRLGEKRRGLLPEPAQTPADVLADRYSLWVSDPEAVCADPETGACLIGRAFTTADHRRITSLCDVPLQVSACHPGEYARQFVTRAWGGYLLACGNDDVRYLLRSPMGQLPCYHLVTPDHWIFASDARLLVKARMLQPQINWRALNAHLRWSDHRTSDTCLAGLTECVPGALLRVGDQAADAEQIWSPWPFASRTAELLSPHALREVVCGTTAAWIRDAPHIVVPASGGLDSSIVCAALAAARKPFTCVTMSTADASGDERPYVRRLAEHLGAGIAECVFDQREIDLTRSASQHLPRPNRKPFMQHSQRVMRHMAVETGSPLILDGNGGDNVFCYLHSSLPVVDRWRCEGLGSGTFHTLLDVSRLTQADVWTISRMVLRHRLGAIPARSVKRDDRFLASVISPGKMPAALTPWLAEARGRLPGKQAHVDLIMRIQNHVDGYPPDDGAPILSPLLSQPIVELCMQVPTWRWCAGGRNRAFAREAFEHDLPELILQRTAKAGPDSFLMHLFADSRPLLRTLLRDGLLATNGLLNRHAVTEAIDDPDITLDNGILRLFDLAEAEAWARSWISG